MTIRVMLVDDHAIVRTGLKAVLGSAADIEVVGEASGGEEALDILSRTPADVVVMDLSMTGGDGLAATRAIRARDAAQRVLVLTMHAEEAYLEAALNAGASGYIVKSAADRELVEAVRVVARGERWLPPTATSLLDRTARRRETHAGDRARYERLTERERAVLRLVAQGYTAPEIGEQLTISPKTVDTYKQRINDKLGLTHRADYVKLALAIGLLQPQEA